MKKYVWVIALLLVVISGCSLFRDQVYMPKPPLMTYVPAENGQSDFWMSYYEITNWQYRDYLSDLLWMGDTPAYHRAYPDTSLINQQLWIGRRYDYFQHPMFDNFPVVGLTTAQMENYAVWLGDWYRDKYKGAWEMEIRLPTEHEWRTAAQAANKLEEPYVHGKHYANSKGCYLMWFYTPEDRMLLGTDSQRTDGYYLPDTLSYSFENEWYKASVHTKNFTKEKERTFRKGMPYAGMPVHVYSFFPNDYAFYQLTGNVAERVLNADGSENTMGGSFRTSAAYCKVADELPYPYDATVPQIDVGFRLVCRYEKVQTKEAVKRKKQNWKRKRGD